jgi:hypothetical protein
MEKLIHESEREKKESDALRSLVKGPPWTLYKCLHIFMMILENKLSFLGKTRVWASTRGTIGTVRYILDSLIN